jgi:hypothetical protein
VSRIEQPAVLVTAGFLILNIKKRSMKMDELLVQFSGLVGYAALVTFVVNALKTLNVVKDGQAQNWVAGLNLLGLAGLLGLKVFAPEADVAVLDAQLGDFVNVMMVVFAYVVQMLGSKLSYIAIKNVPLIGKSFSG